MTNIDISRTFPGGNTKPSLGEIFQYAQRRMQPKDVAIAPQPQPELRNQRQTEEKRISEALPPGHFQLEYSDAPDKVVLNRAWELLFVSLLYGQYVPKEGANYQVKFNYSAEGGQQEGGKQESGKRRALFVDFVLPDGTHVELHSTYWDVKAAKHKGLTASEEELAKQYKEKRISVLTAAGVPREKICFIFSLEDLYAFLRGLPPYENNQFRVELASEVKTPKIFARKFNLVAASFSTKANKVVAIQEVRDQLRAYHLIPRRK